MGSESMHSFKMNPLDGPHCYPLDECHTCGVARHLHHDPSKPIYTQAQLDSAVAEAIASQWLPMETAPKDGSYQLVARFSGDELLWFYRARFKERRNEWMTTGGVIEPTHWMKLPNPPAIRNPEK